MSNNHWSDETKHQDYRLICQKVKYVIE